MAYWHQQHRSVSTWAPVMACDDKSALVQVMAWYLTGANVDPDRCRHMVSLGHKGLMSDWKCLCIWCFVFSYQPPRLSHPVIKFSCAPCEPMILENVPFDKYELEPSPLTQYILERRQPNVSWQVSDASSCRSILPKLWIMIQKPQIWICRLA